jgi:hypothetical protein
VGLNFLGLGFNFGSQDKGLGKSIKTTASGLKDINTAVVGIGLAGAKMTFKMPNVKGAIGGLTNLANDVKVTTTYLEAYGVSANKVSSAGLAGLNLTTNQFRKLKGQISSTAFSMNIDVGTVTQSMVALKQSGVDVRKIGFKSFKQFQKFMSITGTDAKKFAASVAGLRTQFGFTDDQTKDLIQSTAALGKKLDLGKEAVSGMADVTKMMAEETTGMFKEWGPKKIKQFQMGTIKVAGALKSMGATGAEAMQTSKAFTGQLIKGQAGMQSLFAGLSTTMGVDMDTLTQHLGSPQAAFDALQKSPEDFALHMAKMSSNVQKVAKEMIRTKMFGGMSDEAIKASGQMKKFDAEVGKSTTALTSRFSLQMKGAFGPGMTNLINKGLGPLEKSLKATKGEVKGGDKDIASYTKKWSDGRTAAERFAIAQSRVLTSMKQVHGVMKDTTFINKYKKDTGALVKELDKMSRKGGVLGAVTRKMIEMRVHGIGGVLAVNTKWGFAVTEMAKQFAPVIAGAGSAAMAFRALASPITIIIGLFAGLFFVFKDLEKGDKSIIRPWLKRLKANLPKIFMAIKGALIKAFSVLKDVVIYVINNVPWKKVGMVLGQAFSAAMKVAIKIVRWAFKAVFKIGAWLADLPWGAIGKKLGGWFAELAVIAIGAFYKVMKKLPEIILTVFNKLVDFVIGALDGISEYLQKKFPEYAKPIRIFFNVVKAIIHAVRVVIVGAFKAIVWVVKKIFWGLVAIFKGIFKVIEWVIIKPFKLWLKIVTWVVGKVVGAFKWVGNKIAAMGKWLYDKLTWPFRKLWGYVSSVAGWIKDKLGAVGDFIGGVGSAIGGAVSGAVSAIGGLFSSGSMDGMKFVREMEKKMKEAADAAVKEQERVKAERIRLHKVEIQKRSKLVTTMGQLNKTTNKEVVAAVQEQLKAGIRVETVTGKIIDAEKAVVHYSRTAAGEIKKVGFELKNMQLAKITEESFVKGKEMMLKFRQETNRMRAEHGQGSKEFGEHLDNWQGKFREFRKEHGISAQSASGWNTILSRQFAVEKSLVEGLGKEHASYAAALTKQQTETANAMAREIKALETAFNAKKRRTKEDVAAHDAAIKEMQKKWQPYRDQIKESAAILSSSMSSQLEKFAGNANKQMLFAERAAQTYADAMKAQGAAVAAGLKGTTDATKSHIQSVYNKIAEAQKKEMFVFLRDTKLKGAELDAAANKIKTKYTSMAEEVGKNTKLAQQNLMKGSTKGFDNLNAKMLSKLDETNKKLNVKSKAMAGAIEKEFGMAGDQAVDAVLAISKINPKKFERNMRRVTKSFKKFLTSLDKEMKKLVKDTAKAVNEFWMKSQKGWEDQEKLVVNYGDKVRRASEKMWEDIVKNAKSGIGGLTKVSRSISGSIKAIFGNINILDLLASPDQIRNWANRIIDGLGLAFSKGGSSFNMLIDRSFTRALGVAAGYKAKEMATATPSAGGTAEGDQEVKTGASAVLSLKNAVHNPAWARSSGTIATKLDVIAKEVQKLKDVIATAKGIKAVDLEE